MRFPTFAFIGIYLACAPTLTLGFKYLFSNLDFHFPLSTINILLFLEWCIAAIVRPYVVTSNTANTSAQTDSIIHKYATTIIGLCLATELGASNLSLLTLSVSFHTMVKSSTPAYVLFFSTLFRLESPNIQLIVVVLIIIFGVALCSFGEIKFALSGFVFATISCAAAGLRWTISHLYLIDSSSPIELLYRSLPAAWLGLPLFSAAFEFFELWKQIDAMNSSTLFDLVVVILFFAIVGFGMVLVELYLVHRISSLSFSVLAVLKELLVVLLSIYFNHDGLGYLNWFGFILSLSGVFMFKYIRRDHHVEDEFVTQCEEEAIFVGGDNPFLENSSEVFYPPL